MQFLQSAIIKSLFDKSLEMFSEFAADYRHSANDYMNFIIKPQLRLGREVWHDDYVQYCFAVQQGSL
jgi:hypothetical protein